MKTAKDIFMTVKFDEMWVHCITRRFSYTHLKEVRTPEHSEKIFVKIYG